MDTNADTDRRGACGHKCASGVLCPTCADATRRRLDEIPGLMVRLSRDGIAYRSVTAFRSGYISFTPADVNLISLLDRRSGVTAMLASWAADFRECLDLAQPIRPEPVGVLVVRHLGWLDWVTREHPAADEYAHEVASHHRQLLDAADGAPQRILIGTCPTIYDDGGVCGEQLRADPASQVIRCSSCKVSWTYEHWQRLGMILQHS